MPRSFQIPKETFDPIIQLEDNEIIQESEKEKKIINKKLNSPEKIVSLFEEQEESENEEIEKYEEQNSSENYEQYDTDEEDNEEEYDDDEFSLEEQNEFQQSYERLPEILGLNPSKMQVMKGFLFEQDTNDMFVENEFQPNKKQFLEIETIPKKQKLSSTSFIEKSKSLIINSPQPQLNLEDPKYVLSKKINVNDTIVEVDSQRCNKDMGLFMGRSFRVGFSQNGQIIHPGFASNQKKKKSLLFSNIVRETIQISPDLKDSNISNKYYVPILENHLDNSTLNISETRQPHFELNTVYSNINDNISNFNEMIKSNIFIKESTLFNSIQHSQLVWCLIDALWGPDSQFTSVFSNPSFGDNMEDGYENDNIISQQEMDIDSVYGEQLSRRLAFGTWLKSAVTNNIEVDLENDKDPLEQIFTLLTGKQIENSVNVACSNSDFRLATIISQAHSDTSIQQDLQEQLKIWQDKDIDNLIESKYIEIYKILSGNVLDFYENRWIDWMRCFGLHFWYGTKTNSPITEALISYQHAVEQNFASPPIPFYLEKNFHFSELTDDQKKLKDTCYHLIKLFCRDKFSYKIPDILDPLSSSPCALDYSLSWHLHTVLQRLGYPNIQLLYPLYSSYVLQLEISGLWFWGVYVVLNFPDVDQQSCHDIRKENVMELLSRHTVELLNSPHIEEEFLLEKLRIPIEWIEEVKGWYYHFKGDYKQELQHLLNSHQWVNAHKILIDFVAPEKILDDSLDYLHNILQILEENSDCLANWEYYGSVYLDYIIILKEFPILLDVFISQQSNIMIPEEQEHEEEEEELPYNLTENLKNLIQLDYLASDLLKRLIVQAEILQQEREKNFNTSNYNDIASDSESDNEEFYDQDFDNFDTIYLTQKCCCLSEMSTRITKLIQEIKRMIRVASVSLQEETGQMLVGDSVIQLIPEIIPLNLPDRGEMLENLLVASHKNFVNL